MAECGALQASLGNGENAGAVSIRSLVKNALRMRPTRIVVGEVRGGEALDMLSAMNSGHEGSMCTIHANGARQALSKLRTYAMMAEEALPARALTEMIAEAIDLVVHLRLETASGRRVVASVYEVTGLEQDAVSGSELFGLHDDRRLRWTGIRPRCAERGPEVRVPIELEHNTAREHVLRARALMRKGDALQARELLARALQLDPTEGDAAGLLREANEALGGSGKARLLW